MTAFKEKISNLLFFALGICWGYLWITEVLSCPEWWFLGVNALLIGAGIWLVKKLPDSWRCGAPALLVMLVFSISNPNLRSVLLPLVFGMWYGSDTRLFDQWKISRIFCGGLLIGGVLTGVFLPHPLHIPLLVTLVLINSAWNHSFRRTIAMVGLSLLFFWFHLPLTRKQLPGRLDPGTVISAFALVEDQPEKLPKIAFVGNNELLHSQSIDELHLNLVSKLYFCNLPGTLPPASDLIIVTELPSSGDNGVAALRRSLKPNGILVMPPQYWELFSSSKWHILPGSDGEYAATSPQRELKLNPRAMDAQLVKHFSMIKNSSAAPTGGALTGMLATFYPEVITLSVPAEKSRFYHLLSGGAATLLLLILWIIRSKNSKTENLRIWLNCTGYTLLAGLTLPILFNNLPIVASVRALLTILSIMWIFRRPAPRRDNRRYIGFAGLLALLALAAVWFGSWIAAAAALLFGGYAFAALDGELCTPRNNSEEALRFLGIAAGAFICWWFFSRQISFAIAFCTVAAMRFWSWFRG